MKAAEFRFSMCKCYTKVSHGLVLDCFTIEKLISSIDKNWHNDELFKLCAAFGIINGEGEPNISFKHIIYTTSFSNFSCWAN